MSSRTKGSETNLQLQEAKKDRGKVRQKSKPAQNSKEPEAGKVVAPPERDPITNLKDQRHHHVDKDDDFKGEDERSGHKWGGPLVGAKGDGGSENAQHEQVPNGPNVENPVGHLFLVLQHLLENCLLEHLNVLAKFLEKQ